MQAIDPINPMLKISKNGISIFFFRETKMIDQKKPEKEKQN